MGEECPSHIDRTQGEACLAANSGRVLVAGRIRES